LSAESNFSLMGKGWIFNILFLILMPRRNITSPALKTQGKNWGQDKEKLEKNP
jgi:hypothetical protein